MSRGNHIGIVDNPNKWLFGGYQELTGRRQRYKIIDQGRVLQLLGKNDIVRFREWYIKTLDHKYSRKLLQEEEKFWSNSFAVGVPAITKGELINEKVCSCIVYCICNVSCCMEQIK